MFNTRVVVGSITIDLVAVTDSMSTKILVANESLIVRLKLLATAPTDGGKF